jgi:integrase
VKAVTVKKEVACIRHLFRKAEEWGHVAINPTKRVKDLPDDSEPRQRFLTTEEFAALEREARDSRPLFWNLPREPFLYWPEFLVVAVNTGLRRAELLNLEFIDINFESRVLCVRNKPKLGFHVKNYQERYIPLTTDACEALLSLRAAKAKLTEFVFHKSNGERWQDLSEGLGDELVRRAGLDRTSGPITLRTRLARGWHSPAFRVARFRRYRRNSRTPVSVKDTNPSYRRPPGSPVAISALRLYLNREDLAGSTG